MSDTINFPSTVDQLRTALLDMGEDPETVASMRKGELRERLIQLSQEKMEFQLEALKSDDEEPQTLAKAINIEYGSKEWNDYIIGMLDENEQIDGYPKVNGLARVVNILGDVVSSKATQVLVTHGENRSVTVNYEIAIEWKLNTPIGFGNLGYTPQIRVFGGCADCTEDPSNTFLKHPAAIAETKAYGRALRKALGLTIIAAEEMLSGSSEEIPKAKPSASISKPLESAIRAKASTLKLNLEEVMIKGGYDQPLSSYDMQDGRAIFTLLNSYQQN